MRILFLADPASHDLHWLAQLSGRHECYVLLRHQHFIRYKPEQLSLIEAEYGFTIVGSLPDCSFARPLRLIKSLRVLRQVVQQRGIEFLHLMYAEPNALWALASRYLRIPCCITTRGTDILVTIPQFFQSKNRWQQFIAKSYRSAFQKAAFITCTSHKQQDYIQALFQIPASRIKLVRTGVDFSNAIGGPADELPETLQGRRYVVFPRSMRPLYNHTFSLDAIGQLPSQILGSCVFVFVDNDSVDQLYVSAIKQRMASMTGVSFLFLNRQSQAQLYTLFRHAHLVVMNPLSDGTPVSAIEAIACGTPVILGPLPYDADLFGQYPYRLNEWSVHELATLMQELLQHDKPDMQVYANHLRLRVSREQQMNLLSSYYQETLQHEQHHQPL